MVSMHCITGLVGEFRPSLYAALGFTSPVNASSENLLVSFLLQTLSLRIKHFESEIAGDYVHTVGRIAGDIRCISLYVMETVNFFLIHISWYMGHF